jgi:hypothetical protein
MEDINFTNNSLSLDEAKQCICVFNKKVQLIPSRLQYVGLTCGNNLFYSNNYPVQMRVSWHIYTL